MTTPTAVQQQQITQILQAEVECVNDLLLSLESEYDALAEQHADALEEVVRDKQIKIQRLEAVTRQREQLLNSFDDTVAVEKQSQSEHQVIQNNKQLADLWEKLVVIAEKCREKNRVNGSIVETASRQSRHALDILRGITPNSSSNSETYDNSGRTTSFTNKHTLVHV